MSTATARLVRAREAEAREAAAREARIADEIERLDIAREARRRLDARDHGTPDAPEIVALDELLARPVPQITHRIDGWMPTGSRGILSATAKSGKTTLSGGLIRSLVDGDPWLGAVDVRPITGRLAVLDLEMGQRQGAAWLRAQGIQNAHRVLIVSLRGRARSFDILDAAIRRKWAARFRDLDVEYLILDPLRPVLDAIGLDEHREAGRFLAGFDGLLTEAGISEALIVHHMGHAGERSRGDSRLRDWPDFEWRIVRESDDAASPRYLAAYGRDVDIPETRLAYDAATRRLTIAGGSRRDARLDAALDAVLDVLAGASEPMSGRAIKAALADAEIPRDLIDAALRAGRESDRLTFINAKNAKLYSPSIRVSGGVRLVSGDTPSECPPPSMKADTRTLVEGGASVRL